MKRIKLFEKFDIRENTEDDIYGIFTELLDIGYKIEVDVIKSMSGDQISVCIYKPDDLEEICDDLEEIYERLKMFEDYLGIYLKEYEIKYYGNYKFSYSENLEQRYIGKTYHTILNNNFKKQLREIIILIIEE